MCVYVCVCVCVCKCREHDSKYYDRASQVAQW